MFYSSIFIGLKILFDVYAVLIFLKVIQIYLIVFHVISSQNLISSTCNSLSFYTIDPFIFLILHFFPWLEDYLVSFVFLIFSFLTLYKFLNILCASEDELFY